MIPMYGTSDTSDTCRVVIEEKVLRIYRKSVIYHFGLNYMMIEMFLINTLFHDTITKLDSL